MIFDKLKNEVDDLLSRYPVKRSALLPLLYIAQREEGYVSEPSMKEIAKLLDLTPSQVYETVTFYSMYNLKPIGKFHIQVCRSLMCALVGSDNVVEWIHKKVGIAPGQTSSDKNFTLSVVECLGSCGTGPMMQVNDDYYERLTEEKVGQVLDELKQKGASSKKSGPFMFPEMAK
ncbi:NADH-quinone oxidoreductase subunit NuoE [Candidatus Nitrospira salsa]|nr:MAG: NADH-quinone oxidoreductase subunit E [Nitrospirales bacterium]